MNPLQQMHEDIQAVLKRDPATRSVLEAVLVSPGLHALWGHRVAHRWWKSGWRLAARLLAHWNRMLTGVEIHPAAQIGRRVVIDHGMGIVVGETAQIGDDVLMYHGVTLGGSSYTQAKRHPTIGNGVILGAGSKIIGPVVVGDGAKVGAGSVVLKDVPAGATAVGVPARILERSKEAV